MNTSIARSETLLEVALAPMDMVRQVGLVIGFSLLTALAAQIAIPIGPIPITGQTFAVLLTGALLGSRLGAMAMIAYLIEGASGLPYFSRGYPRRLLLLGQRGGYQHQTGESAGKEGRSNENTDTLQASYDLVYSL